MLRNRDDAWGAVAKTFHWLFAVVILAQLVLGKVADDAKLSPLKLDLFVWHKSIGVTLLLLAVFRIAWRLANRPPSAISAGTRWEHWAAMASHTLLYVLMIAVPISGWWVSDTSRIPFKAFWLVPVPDLLTADKAASQVAGLVHGILTKTLLVLIALHLAAALRHHFILRNDTLRRMMPSRRREQA
jgi:cytochrome b561